MSYHIMIMGNNDILSYDKKDNNKGWRCGLCRNRQRV